MRDVNNLGSLNLTMFIAQGINLELINNKDKFEETLILIRATSMIKVIQQRFREWYWSPKGHGGSKTIQHLNNSIN